MRLFFLLFVMFDQHLTSLYKVQSSYTRENIHLEPFTTVNSMKIFNIYYFLNALNLRWGKHAIDSGSRLNVGGFDPTMAFHFIYTSTTTSWSTQEEHVNST